MHSDARPRALTRPTVSSTLESTPEVLQLAERARTPFVHARLLSSRTGSQHHYLLHAGVVGSPPQNACSTARGVPLPHTMQWSTP